MFWSYLAISGDDEGCMDFSTKAFASDEELYERIPKFSVAF